MRDRFNRVKNFVSDHRVGISYSVGVTTGVAASVLYTTKYKTICDICHLTPEQIEIISSNAEMCIEYALRPNHRVLVTTAPMPV